MDNKLRFLLVDDDPIFLAVSESIVLTLGDHQVTAAQSGAEGLGKIKKAGGSFDVIILDLNMPDMDGLSFLRNVGATGFKGSVLISSGEVEAVLRSAQRMGELLKVNVLGALRKPLTRKGLEEALKQATRLRDETFRPGRLDIDLSLGDLELIPYYQAQHDIRSGAIVGVETLIRARGPDGQIHGPGKMFGLIHKHDDLLETTMAITGKVMADLKCWNRVGLRPRTSINLDARIVEDASTLPRLLDLTSRHGVEPAQICLELTESALPSDLSRLIESLTRLRMKGFELSIDDYGTGMSNFELLRLCPFTELKLDGTVIRAAAGEFAPRRFSEATVAIARDLGLAVIAEGVETQEQLELVLSLGIGVVQGFFFSRPCPAPDMLERLDTQKRHALDAAI